MAETVGSRIRALRERAGLSQQQLVADLPVSASYISLIESGRRQPREAVLEVIARRLGCTTRYLLEGRGGPGSRDLELELRFAEMALRSGEREAARDRFKELITQAQELGHEDIAHDARWGLSRAQVTLGDLESAIETMEALSQESHLKGSFSRTRLASLLAHTYIECGEPSRAVEIAQAGLHGAAGGDTVDRDEVTELSATLVFAYYNRGEFVRAHLLVQQVIADAEAADSPRSKAAAYWNAGLVADARGDLRAARAYTERPWPSAGNWTAAERPPSCAWIILRSPHPDVEEAAGFLERAHADLATDGSSVDLALVETEQARCRLLAGDGDGAIRRAEAALQRLGHGQRLESATAMTVLARAHLAAGRIDEAGRSYAEAARRLESVEASRQAAALWRELAEGLRDLGLKDEAMTAYERAAVAAGLHAQPLPRSSVTVHGVRRS